MYYDVKCKYCSIAALLVAGAQGWSPSNQYAPGYVPCESDQTTLVRPGLGLYDAEMKWVESRREKANEALAEYVMRQKLDFDPKPLLQERYTIGHAFSGGGFRAMLTGAGIVKALDARTEGSTSIDGVGGLFQASTYVTGLSGGSWLLGSLYMNNITTIGELQSRNDVWDFYSSLLVPKNAFEYWWHIGTEVNAKSKAKFPISITDLWGRVLSKRLIGLPDGGPALSWSDMQQWDWFQRHEAPLPIIVACGREPDTIIISDNSTLFETTPWELGSYDPSLRAFTRLDTIGTEVSNGMPLNQMKCVHGFDNSGFVFGTSSSLFNEFILLMANRRDAISRLLFSLTTSIFDSPNSDVAVWAPNPFRNFTTHDEYDRLRQKIGMSPRLALVDGGEDGQNIPLQPLLNPDREVDVIFAWDSSADSDNHWPMGLAMTKTYERQFQVQGNLDNPVVFPHVPDTETFVNLGLNEGATFFGCDNETESFGRQPPLVVYVANYPQVFWSNTSTFQLSYNKEQVDSMIDNGYHVASQMNSTGNDWSGCIACALLKREIDRRHVRSPFCQKCFETHCWNGDRNITDSRFNFKMYNPELRTKLFKTKGSEKPPPTTKMNSTGRNTGKPQKVRTIRKLMTVPPVWDWLFPKHPTAKNSTRPVTVTTTKYKQVHQNP